MLPGRVKPGHPCWSRVWWGISYSRVRRYLKHLIVISYISGLVEISDMILFACYIIFSSWSSPYVFGGGPPKQLLYANSYLKEIMGIMFHRSMSYGFYFRIILRDIHKQKFFMIIWHCWSQLKKWISVSLLWEYLVHLSWIKTCLLSL